MLNVCQHLNTGLVFVLVFSTRRVNTETSDNQWFTRGGRNPRDTHLPDLLWGSFSLRLCGHLSSYPPTPRNQIPPLSRGERKGWEMEIWRFDQRQKGICCFFWISLWKLHLLTVGRPHCVHLWVCIPYAYNTAVCTNVKSRLKGGKNSVSLDESACCLLKLLEQQSHTLWVPVCLISCCHFSSCSLVNHLSRSPPCNQLNLVIKWRKLKNAAQRRCRLLQKKHVPATKWSAFRQENRSGAATEFKSVCVLLKVI